MDLTFTEAERAFRQSIEVSREVGNRRQEGPLLCLFANLLLETGRGEESRRTWQEGAALLRQCGAFEELGIQSAAMREHCEKAGIPPHEEAAGER